jgi:hypothetical protein
LVIAARERVTWLTQSAAVDQLAALGYLVHGGDIAVAPLL